MSSSEEEQRPASRPAGDGLTRRRLIGTAVAGVVVGGGVATGAVLGATSDEGESAADTVGETTPNGNEEPDGGGAGPTVALATFTAAQAETLAALVDRLIPSDDLGPGATEAGVVAYIDRALASDLSAQRDLYINGLDALDAFATREQGDRFAALEAQAQDGVVGALEADEAEGFVPGSSAFFETARQHTLEGMFGDPSHGGNQGEAGWKLLGYPGVKLTVPPEDQEIDATPTGGSASAYQLPDFGLALGRETNNG